VNRRWGLRTLLASVGVAGAVLLGGGLAAAPAQAAGVVRADTSDFTFDSLHTDYTLTRDAAGRANLEVEETFKAVFPDFDQNHGIERAIPRSADGRSLDLRVKSVADGDGRPIQFQSSDGGGFTVLRIGDPYGYVHGAQTYVIDYTMRNVVQQPLFSSAQRFFYDVNGTGWSQPFGEVTATLHVPDDLASALSGDDHCFQGPAGSTETCEITRTDAGFTASGSGLRANQTVTMIVGFKAGTFSIPFAWQRLVVWVLLGIAVLALIWAIVVAATKLGNPKGTGIIVPQYQAFPGIGVMEAAELLDERDRAFPALVTELVVSRAAQMTRDDRGTKKTSDDVYSLHLRDATVLDDEDSDAVSTLFGSIKPGKTVTLDRTEPKIGDRIGKLLFQARLSVRKQGLIQRKSTPASRLLIALGVILAIASVVWLVIVNVLALSSIVHNLALVLAALIGIAIVVIAFPRERRTEQAVPAYEHLLGIRDYLRLAEADRLRMLQSPSGAETAQAPDGEQVVKLFEKLLPYAILFGIEKEWREVLGRYWATTPTDVSPTIGPLPALFFANTFASSHYATTASVESSSHSWSGSGGSSSFGGGSAGGGFGGGGGGGW